MPPGEGRLALGQCTYCGTIASITIRHGGKVTAIDDPPACPNEEHNFEELGTHTLGEDDSAGPNDWY